MSRLRVVSLAVLCTMEVIGRIFKYRLEGKVEYNITIDRVSGWIIDATITHDFQGEVESYEDSKILSEVDFPIAIKNIVKVSDL